MNLDEQLLRAAFEAIPTMCFVVDPAGLLVAVNDFGARTLGYSAGEIVGRPWLDLTYEADRDSVRAHAEACFREVGRLIQWETRKARGNGEIMEVRETGHTVLVNDHPVLFIACENVTERKRLEQALRQSERYLAEAQRLAHTGSWTHNYVTAKTTHYSDEAFRLFGLDPRRGHVPQYEETMQLIHPDDRKRLRAELEQIFRDKAEYAQDYRVVLPNGAIRYLQSIGHPVRGPAGELLEYFGTVMDVTERRRAEKRLLVQTQVTRILSETSTLKEAIAKILPAVCETLGWHLSAFWEVDRQANLIRCADLWRAPSVAAAEFETATRAGTFVPGEGLPGRVWARGEPACIRDVADDADFPRAKLASRAGLRGAFAFPVLLGNEVLGVIENFSVDLWQSDGDLVATMCTIGSQIGQFAKRAAAVDELRNTETRFAHMTRVMTMGELTASIAHEVTQPLGAIVTSAASCTRWLAAQPPQMDKARRALERIANDGRRAAEVIQRIRALMKHQTPRKSWLDINETILQVLELAQHELRRSDIRLETRLEANLPRVNGDRIQLQQVLLNLIVNAIEAMSGIERRQLLTVLSAAAGPETVRVEVRDSGTGLEPNATRLFEPFYTTKAGGLGIGLSVSRSIVEAHGGQLGAGANSPRGAVFWFALPVQESVP